MAFSTAGWGMFPRPPHCVEFGSGSVMPALHSQSPLGGVLGAFGSVDISGRGMTNGNVPCTKSMMLLQPPQSLLQPQLIASDQSLDSNVFRSNLTSLQQQMMLLERNMMMSQTPNCFDPTLPNLQLQNMISFDLIQKLKSIEQSNVVQNCGARFGDNSVSQLLNQSGLVSPHSSHTGTSATGGASDSSRSSESPSNASSASTSDRPASPDPVSPHKSHSSSEGKALRPARKTSSCSEASHRSSSVSSGSNSSGKLNSPRSHESSTSDGGSQEIKSRKRSWKILLTADLAAQIYSQRPQRGESTGPSSMDVASKCGVNSKTIRDIWNRETWVRATRSLWTPEEEESYHEMLRSKGELNSDGAEGPAGPGDDNGQGGASKRRGRPKGVKDSRPRKSRCAAEPGHPESPATAPAPPAGSFAAASGQACLQQLSQVAARFATADVHAVLSSPAGAGLTLPPIGVVYGRPWMM